MLQEKFNNIVTNQMKKCWETLFNKGNEYATVGNDRLLHFKKAAAVMESTPKAALFGMLSKHLISLSDMCMDKRKHPKEVWSEKITDSINYLLILAAIVEEEQIEQD